MSVLTDALHSVLADDATLAGLLALYEGEAAVFTTDPAPDDANLPYIVTAGEVAQTPWDTKTTQGRRAVRDVRCYTAKTGSAATVEAIAERVRALLHRQTIAVDDYDVIIARCTGPVAADEEDAYGRIVSVELVVQLS